MQYKNINITILFCFGISACSSAPKNNFHAENVGEEKVLVRIDEMSSRPDWLTEGEPFKIVSGKVLSLGQTVIPADHNLSAAYRIAENNAKGLVSHSIEQRLDYVFQNSEESTTTGTSQAHFIGAEASKLTTNSLRPSKRYWEKVSTVDNYGQVTLEYRVFALVEMPEQDFRAAIADAIRKSQGRSSISAEFAKKVDEHWDKFVNADVQPRQPSAEKQ
ncbi:MAG: hypothetical protein ACXVCR_07460 [Bdellovibrio sp.]